jgi:predicted outer membrane repeat protein
MKKFLAVIFLFCTFAMNAQIMEVSGNQSGTWRGEVHLVGDVVVEEGTTLTIIPDTKIISDLYYGITVCGSFYAEGTENERITFTVADTTGYSDYENTKAGAWKGILFSKPDTVKISYCEFFYGKTALDGDGGAMRIYMANNFELSHSVFHHNTTRKRGGAIFAEDSALNIHDCEVCDNFGIGELGSYCWGIGCQFLKCDVNMHDMVFHDNYSEVAYGGGMNVDSCNLSLNNAIFYNNFAVDAGGLGIQRCKNYSVKVSNMLAYNNSVIHYGGGFAVATSDPEMNNLTIVDNVCGGGGGAGFQTAFDASPVINNSIIYGNHAYYVTMDEDTVEYYLGSQIWIWGSDCNLVFNNSDIQYGIDTINGYDYIAQYNNMLDDNPLFVDAENHDYQLLASSHCVNTGMEDIAGLFIPDFDLAGEPRVFNEIIDMGCYEWNNIGINEHIVVENSLSVYPNPLNYNAFCVVNLNKQSNVVLKLISLDGKEVYSENCGTFEAGENRISLDGIIKNVEKGNKVYLLMIDNQSVKIVY